MYACPAEWRGLKIVWDYSHVGSTPTGGTTQLASLRKYIKYLIIPNTHNKLPPK
jgi:hypothetical protein